MKLQQDNRNDVKAAIVYCSQQCRKLVDDGFGKNIEELKKDQTNLKIKEEDVGKKKKAKSSLESNR
jgi:hypothetical protein